MRVVAAASSASIVPAATDFRGPAPSNPTEMGRRRQVPTDDCTPITWRQCVNSRVVTFVCALLLIGFCAGVVPNAAAQPYKDRQVVEVLRDFQRQGVRVNFSTALVTPDMRVAEEPRGDDPQDIIIAILAPRNLTLSVGLRGILLVVRAKSEFEADRGGRAATNASMGAIAGTVRDRTTRRPVSAATVRVERTRLSAVTRDDGRFRLSMVPAGARTLIVHASNYEPLVSEVRVSPRRTTTLLLETERIQPVGRARGGSFTRIP